MHEVFNANRRTENGVGLATSLTLSILPCCPRLYTKEDGFPVPYLTLIADEITNN